MFPGQNWLFSCHLSYKNMGIWSNINFDFIITNVSYSKWQQNGELIVNKAVYIIRIL